MSEQLQFIIVVAFGALCFGCGYLAGFIVTRIKWRREMIRRAAARYNSQTGKWEWGEPPEKPKAWEYGERGGSRGTSPSRRNRRVQRETNCSDPRTRHA